MQVTMFCHNPNPNIQDGRKENNSGTLKMVFAKRDKEDGQWEVDTPAARKIRKAQKPLSGSRENLASVKAMCSKFDDLKSSQKTGQTRANIRKISGNAVETEKKKHKTT